jgi:hypothetical protein
MSPRHANLETTPRSAARQPGSTLVSLVVAKAGREALWVLIAGAFLVVEALVFVTERPASRLFHRRETSKVAGHNRRG